MPRALTVCVVHGCPRAAVHRGRCESHARKIARSKWRRTIKAVIERDGGICWLCGQPGADTADHVVRWAHGGSDELGNLRAAHVLCNMRRG